MPKRIDCVNLFIVNDYFLLCKRSEFAIVSKKRKRKFHRLVMASPADRRVKLKENKKLEKPSS